MGAGSHIELSQSLQFVNEREEENMDGEEMGQIIGMLSTHIHTRPASIDII